MPDNWPHSNDAGRPVPAVRGRGVTTLRASHLRVIAESGILDPEQPLGEALRALITEFVEEGDGCLDPVTCAVEQHPSCRAHPIEFLDWIKMRIEVPRTRRPLANTRRARWKRKRDAALRTQRMDIALAG